jgi:hypothetical protein
MSVTDRDYTAYAAQRREELGKAGVFFKLYGQRYDVVMPLPAGAMLDLLSAETDSEAVNGFFASALLPADWQRLQKAIRDPRKPVDLSTLNEIIGGIAEDMSGRPTRASSSSESGRSTAGPSTKSSSRRKASTGSASDGS